MRLPRPLALVLLAALDVIATRRAWLPPVERAALFVVSLATLSAMAGIAAMVTRRRMSVIWAVLPAILLLALPLRWYPFSRLALAVVACWLVAPFCRVRQSAALAVAAAAAAIFLLAHSDNLRFVAFDQAPLAGAILSQLPHVTHAHGAARAMPGSVEQLPAFGDAHIVLITVDARRADHPVPLSGLRFTHAYAQAPSTAWSLTALMTGTPPDRLDASPPTLAEILRAKKWRTESFYPAGLFFDGRTQLERYARTHFGFEWAETRTLDAPALTDAVLSRLAALQKDGEPRAFFWVHYFDAHEPYVTHPGLTEGDSPRARYDGEVAFVDGELRRLMAGLAQLSRPVIVCVTADHGEEFGEHGGAYHGSSLYDEQVRVPLVITAPGLLPATVEDPVELTDLAPTLLALAGAGPAAPAFGHDAHSQVGTRRMLVRGDWKLIHDQTGDIDELYQLSTDEAERHNLAGERHEIVAPLHAALDAWFSLTNADDLERTLINRDAPAIDRQAAARELGELLAFSTRPTLRALLDDPDVAAEAALALAQMTDRAALAPLLALLPKPEYRNRAALGLGRMREPRAVPALIETLRDISPERRRLAAHYLGWLGDASAVAPLVAATHDPRSRDEARAALERISQRIPRARDFQSTTSEDER